MWISAQFRESVGEESLTLDKQALDEPLLIWARGKRARPPREGCWRAVRHVRAVEARLVGAAAAAWSSPSACSSPSLFEPSGSVDSRGLIDHNSLFGRSSLLDHSRFVGRSGFVDHSGLVDRSGLFEPIVGRSGLVGRSSLVAHGRSRNRDMVDSLRKIMARGLSREEV